MIYYGHHVGGAIGLGYVPAQDGLLEATWEIEVAGHRVAAEASLRPMYDPASGRMKA